MTKSPEVLNSLESYCVIFEEALAIPHSQRIQRMLKDLDIPSRTTDFVTTQPLPVDQVLLSPVKSAELASGFDKSFASYWSIDPQQHRPGIAKRLRVGADKILRTLSSVYGLGDGRFCSLDEMAETLKVQPRTINSHREQGLYQVENLVRDLFGLPFRTSAEPRRQILLQADQALRTYLLNPPPTMAGPLTTFYFH